MKSMDRWIRGYESWKFSKNSESKELKEPSNWHSNWQSNKYDFSDPEVRLEYVPEKGCSVGACMSSLKLSWRAFEIAGRRGEPRGDLAWRKNHIQDVLGLELTEFQEYPDIYQSQEGEEESGCGEWNLSNINSINEPYMDDMSEEEKQAYRKEKAEGDD